MRDRGERTGGQLGGAAGAEALATIVADAEHLVAFTGAGISTESGIPDFRSPGGIWNRYKPIDYQTFLASDEGKREYWRRGRNTYAVIREARPNPAHLALAELERLGKLQLLITQNIDGLHAAAGSSAERLIELHGTAHRVYCMACRRETARDEISARLDAGEAIPACAHCGGTLRAATVAFGEPLPRAPWRLALEQARHSDLFLVIGSSLVVNPAAQLPLAAVDAGAYLAIVNQTPTPLDDRAHLLLRGPAGRIMALVMDGVRAKLAGAPGSDGPAFAPPRGSRGRAVPDAAGAPAPTPVPAPLPLAVLLSGTGRTLENLLAAIARGELAARVVAVVSSRRGVRGLAVAAAHGIPARAIERREFADDAAFSAAVFDAVAPYAPRLLVLSGFLRRLVIPAEWAGRIINIHPSLLPAFGGRGLYGHRVHEAVLAYGVKVTGCTVHFADEEYDHGPIILQRTVPVLDGDTPETLAERVFAAECALYPEAIALFAAGRLRLEGRWVRVLDG